MKNQHKSNLIAIAVSMIILLGFNSCKWFGRTDPPKPQPEPQGIVVTVKEKGTNKPITNATVKWVSANKEESGPTSGDGIYRKESMDIGDYTVTVSATGYKLDKVGKKMTVAVGKMTAETFELELEPPLEVNPGTLTLSNVQNSATVIFKNKSAQHSISLNIETLQNDQWVKVSSTSLTIPANSQKDAVVTVDSKGKLFGSYNTSVILNYSQNGANYTDNLNVYMVIANPDAPSVSTDPPTGITQTSADVLGKVTSIGGSPVTQRGICWSEKPDPKPESDSKVTISGGGIGSFTLTANNLTAGKTYFVRAFAVNSNGIGLSEVRQFATALSTTPPAVGIDISDIDTKSVTLIGKVTNNGGSAVTDAGFCWNKTGTPTIAADSIRRLKPDANGNFSVKLTTLSPNTKYYVRAFALNDLGNQKPGYSRELPFTLEIAPIVPIINSFLPTAGGYDTEVTVNGDSFDPIASNNKVFFGTVQAQKVEVKSKQQLVVTVPEGAASGVISVQVGQNKGVSKESFTYTLTPSVESVTELPAGMYINDVTVACDGTVYLSGVQVTGQTIVKTGIYAVQKNTDDLTIIHEGSPGYSANGTLATAKFYYPTKITCINNEIYVADQLDKNTYNKTDAQEAYTSIRKLTKDAVETVYYKKLTDREFIHELYYTPALNGLLFMDGSFYKYNLDNKPPTKILDWDGGPTTALDAYNGQLYALDLTPANNTTDWAVNQRRLSNLIVTNSVASGKLLQVNAYPRGMAIDPDRKKAYFVERNTDIEMKIVNVRISETDLNPSSSLTTIYNGSKKVETRPANGKLSVSGGGANFADVYCIAYDTNRNGLLIVDVNPTNGRPLLRLLKYR